MNLNSVIDDLGDALDTIDGLRVHPYSARKINAPAAIVALPDQITYDETYGRGSDSMTLLVHVLVGQASDRASRLAIAAYADGSGAQSVKAVLEAATYTSCDSVTVSRVEFSTFTVAATEYLAASFTVNITGQGA